MSRAPQPSHRSAKKPVSRPRQRRKRNTPGRSPLPPTGHMVLALTLVTGLVGVDLAQSRSQPVTNLPLASQHAIVQGNRQSKGVRMPLLSSLGAWLFADTAVAQGDRLSVNGRTIESRWSRQGDAIFIPDAHLIEGFGMDVLDTSDPSRQPLQWFSDGTQPLPDAATAFDGQFRYLDIGALAQEKGWRIRPQGTVLSIDTPAAQILSVRHGRQEWGDRLVIDLDQPTPFQVVSEVGAMTLTLDAQSSSLPLPDADRTNTLSDIRTASSGQQTTLSLDFSAQHQARVWTTPSPPRMIIDISGGGIPDRAIQWLPGLWWRQQTVRVGTATFPVIFLEILPKDAADLSLQPIWTNPTAMPGIAPLADTAQRWQAVAAINAGFFNRNNQLPLGAIRRDGQWHSGPILNRGAIAWNQVGDLRMGRFSLRETIRLSSGQAFPSLHLNSGYVQAGLSRYTTAWGTSYTPLTDFETLISVENNKVVNKHLVERAGTQSIPIPQNGYMIAARSYRTAADVILPGSDIQAETTAYPPEFDAYHNVMGAGPLLLQNGQVVLNANAEGFSAAFAQQRAPRSAIARTPSGSILLVTVPYHIGGRGPTLAELATLLQQLGAVDALNLDGGNSSSLYLGGRLINRSSRTVGRIHSGIGIFVNP